jgi:RNA polymerase sigma-70 factor (ECF subfamily)
MTPNLPPFDEIYQAHYDDVWRFSLHACGDVHTALELTSRTFLRACQAWPRFRPELVLVKAWLLRIAVNEWRRELRQRKIRRWIPFANFSDAQLSMLKIDAAEVARVEEQLEQDEAYQALRAALSQLPERYQAPILLNYFEHLSVEQVAAVLGRPLGTVKSLLHRGLAKLRAHQGLREAIGLPLERGHEPQPGAHCYESPGP